MSARRRGLSVQFIPFTQFSNMPPVPGAGPPRRESLFWAAAGFFLLFLLPHSSVTNLKSELAVPPGCLQARKRRSEGPPWRPPLGGAGSRAAPSFFCDCNASVDVITAAEAVTMRSLEGAFPPLLFRQGCLLAPSARVIVCYCPKSGVGWAEVSNYAVGGAQILTHAPPPMVRV